MLSSNSLSNFFVKAKLDSDKVFAAMISESWFSIKKDKMKINSIIIYKELHQQIKEEIKKNVPVDEIVAWIKDEVESAYLQNFGINPKTGALNNSIGRWNEYLASDALCEIAIDLNRNHQGCIAIFSIADSRVVSEKSSQSSSNFLNLFDRKEFSENSDLAAISRIRKRIFFPSPDFIVAEISNPELFPEIKRLLKKQSQDPESLDIYQLVKGKLKASEVKAVISLKTSNRPDRRYQPSFEAAIIKAIGYITRQNWKYFMVASELTRADKKLFEEAVSPHEIALKSDAKLVDGLFLYKTKQDLVPVIQAALAS